MSLQNFKILTLAAAWLIICHLEINIVLYCLLHISTPSLSTYKYEPFVYYTSPPPPLVPINIVLYCLLHISTPSLSTYKYGPFVYYTSPPPPLVPINIVLYCLLHISTPPLVPINMDRP